MIDEAALPLRLKECLLCFKDKILRAGFTEERSFVVDAIDYIIETTDKHKGWCDE
ncbi:hypothetical protein KSU1_B0050 [Candidatus Jettenia caeni]|uniref:Uncharacterized protein n=1 Tax=Candidatus Jettenia caeni TaxID=247490 RepID=I3IGR2_9BACT|nr:hypothetical protein [Candidatus Jettenia sp. AMX1]WKZ16242.1 MAG: hypothetical protein QY317_02835 [Candidatus Jettenia caeni]GAB60907.1 hypothetical protein KSU1_B0050 [Candidatus Jettenia caeni]GIL21150.1 MAG: hypothetical protein BroJett041_22640 [Candidatus Jettenia caeni]GJQ46649.1 MAG: hypothetical protein JETCAE04_24030 [Candidatus Jettenia caeni]